jgi:hypothetical protein
MVDTQYGPGVNRPHVCSADSRTVGVRSSVTVASVEYGRCPYFGGKPRDDLLCLLPGIVDFDPFVPDGALDLAMPKQWLDGTQVLSPRWDVVTPSKSMPAMGLAGWRTHFTVSSVFH